MKLTDRIPGSLRWGMRVLAWGIVVLVALPVYMAGSGFRSIPIVEKCMDETSSKGAQQDNLFEVQQFSLCMFLNSSYLQSKRMELVLLDVMALPAMNCKRVGVWKSARNRSVYRVVMRDDGTYSAESVVDYTPSQFSGDGSGFWGEHDGKLIWIHDNGVFWPPDINRIESDTPEKFTLIEVNGQKTEFIRERALESDKCSSS